MLRKGQLGHGKFNTHDEQIFGRYALRDFEGRDHTRRVSTDSTVTPLQGASQHTVVVNEFEADTVFFVTDVERAFGEERVEGRTASLDLVHRAHLHREFYPASGLGGFAAYLCVWLLGAGVVDFTQHVIHFVRDQMGVLVVVLVIELLQGLPKVGEGQALSRLSRIPFDCLKESSVHSSH
ncbi:hypothetical protein D3C85_811570 [compost metagenome]